MNSKWIWYFGDFELYHSLNLHARRSEFDYIFPAFWKISEPYRSVTFEKNYHFDKEETFTIYANGTGNFSVEGDCKYTKYAFGKTVALPAGNYKIEAHVVNLTGLPCIYAEGNAVCSDETWLAGYYTAARSFVGCSDKYTDKNISPENFAFEYKEIFPAEIKKSDNGILYDYGCETFAKIGIFGNKKAVTVYLGETETEAEDTCSCYLREYFEAGNTEMKYAKGFRYLYIPEQGNTQICIKVLHEYLPYDESKCGSFRCSDEMINRIWSVSAHTLRLNSREFFLDGIKRDRWVWSGDAYQSYFANRYLFFDEDIAKRTITVLGDKGAVEQHINTINDYTFYWIISVYDHYMMSGDLEFVKQIYPRMKAFMNFSISRLDKNGFVYNAPGDWIFIDWAEIDKDGPVCAEQLLFLQALEYFIKCSSLIGENDECENYRKLADELRIKINKFFWCEEKGAFIDTFASQKKNVSRHSNIFALLFGYANNEQREKIISNVLLNNAVSTIKTPYFKFYELEAWCNIGKTDYVKDEILRYWGAMIKAGATSFWEEFDPEIPWQQQLHMYGGKYERSLCHAWGASPIYLIGRYFLGIRPISPAYAEFEVSPITDAFENFDAEIPVKDGTVKLCKKSGMITVVADKEGGIFKCKGNLYHLKKDIPVTVKL